MRSDVGRPRKRASTAVLDDCEERIGVSVLHQQGELRVIVPLIFEHARVRLRCPACQRATLASLLAGDGGEFGPRAEADIAMLTGMFRLSRDDARQTLVEVFGLAVYKGSVDRAIMRMSAMLGVPWLELREAIRRADAVHADETTSRSGGATQWLWVVGNSFVACLRTDPVRSQPAAKELVGEEYAGFVISDRYAAYYFLDVLQQQACWRHVTRQLVAVAQRDGVIGRCGPQLIALARKIIAIHRQYLADGHDSSRRFEQLAPSPEQIRKLLEPCAAGGHTRTANFASHPLDGDHGLWIYCQVTGPRFDTANNAAECVVGHVLLQRGLQGGTDSAQRSRGIGRIRSVRQIYRLQHPAVLYYLIDAAIAAHHRPPLPRSCPYNSRRIAHASNDTPWPPTSLMPLRYATAPNTLPPANSIIRHRLAPTFTPL